LNASVSHQTREYLQELFPENKTNDGTYINARLLPDAELASAISSLKENESLVKDNCILARKGSGGISIRYNNDVLLLEKITDLFSKNGEALKRDFELLIK